MVDWVSHPFPFNMMLSLALLPLLFPQSLAQTSPTDSGWWNAEDFVSLEIDGSSIGVRFQEGVAAADAAAFLMAQAGLEVDFTQRPFLAQHMMRFEMVPPLAPKAAAQLTYAMAQDAMVLAASPLFQDDRRDPVYLTGEILLRWNDTTPIARRESLTAGLTQTGTLDYSINPGECFRVPSALDSLAVANEIALSGAVEFCHPNFSLTRVTMHTPNDPIYGDQWHLESTGQLGAKVDADVDAEGAWDYTLGDPNSIVAVVDTGMELYHPDLEADLVQGIDVLSNDNDPKAENGWLGLGPEDHATSVAGVSAAIGDNNEGVTGVSPRSKIMPIRFLSGGLFGPSPSTQDEADAFNFARANGAWVINNSWGPLFGANLAASTKAAVDDCNANGRGGLGMVIFFAAGNSGNNNSNNGYAAYQGIVGVSACNDFGVLSGYSCFGPTVDCAAPSNDNGNAHNGITTTDRHGSKGYDNGNYTDEFGGTSSASPLAAGVMLLTMSANPTLTRSQVLECYLGSCEKIDERNGNYDATGHSDWYGQGRVNAEQAVLAALNFGAPIDVVQLSGTTTGQVGAMANYQLSGMSPNVPWSLYASLSAAGSYHFGARMDLSGVLYTAGSGLADASGNGSLSVLIPGKAAGRTLYLEALAINAMGAQDSNVVTLVTP